MNPTSISASALSTAESCLARYKAENIDKIPRFTQNTAADVGTAVHAALENYVTFCVMHPIEEPTLKTLEKYWHDGYESTFNTADQDTEEFLDGWELLKRWHKRTDFSGVTVLSCEIKANFEVTPPKGIVGPPVPFNYIWDRSDQLEEDVYKVVDYKTIRVPISADGLKNKIQARCYALAAQIKWPNAQRIWVEFDQLRHEAVGRTFTREDNIATWNYIRKTYARILNSDGSEETLNPDCRYCARAISCQTLQKNIDLDGIFAVKNADDAVRMKAAIEARMSAEKNLLVELDDILMRHAENNDITEWEGQGYLAKVSASRRRALDVSRAATIIGPEVMANYGKINISEIDKLLKSDLLTDEQKVELKSLIYYTMGEPSVKITAKNPIDEE